jgi:hypothetical protein
MLGRPLDLRELWRLRERGPQLACPRRDHGGASKSYKIPSVHVVLIPITNAQGEATALKSTFATKIAPKPFAIIILTQLLIESLRKINILSVLRTTYG